MQTIKLPKSYKPKSLEQQQKERAIERQREREEMLSKIPQAVQRAIDETAYWKKMEADGQYVDGNFGDSQDLTAYFEFNKSASRKIKRIIRKLEREARIKYRDA